ncbi:hypothetical protein, partial [Aquitalea pelogenes]|uniref:hypothetical protein n=1 Tax=Aquitalea pelogenes TaxID=1293573 RepID=UPI00195C7544
RPQAIPAISGDPRLWRERDGFHLVLGAQRNNGTGAAARRLYQPFPATRGYGGNGTVFTWYWARSATTA